MFRPKYDLPAFVDNLIKTKRGRLTLDDTLADIDFEVTTLESSLARDAQVRFQQLRYLNSLSRLAQFLRSHELPADLTPRERVAIRSLSDFIGNAPEGLASGFSQVTLPKGIFGQSFEVSHRLAS